MYLHSQISKSIAGDNFQKAAAAEVIKRLEENQVICYNILKLATNKTTLNTTDKVEDLTTILLTNMKISIDAYYESTHHQIINCHVS